MAKPKRPGGPKQKLSPAAARRKAARDLRIAKTPRRTAMKAENQRRRRKAGASAKGKDYDHSRGKFVSVKVNRSATKTTNNTMPTGAKKGGIKAAIKGKKTMSKKKTMTAKYKAAGKKWMAKKKSINKK